MAAYTKEFLIDVFMWRFINCPLIEIEAMERLEEMAEKFYDEVGRDKFRVFASLDADKIRDYKNQS